jgi:hypothetical protein
MYRVDLIHEGQDFRKLEITDENYNVLHSYKELSEDIAAALYNLISVLNGINGDGYISYNEVIDEDVFVSASDLVCEQLSLWLSKLLEDNGKFSPEVVKIMDQVEYPLKVKKSHCIGYPIIGVYVDDGYFMFDTYTRNYCL